MKIVSWNINGYRAVTGQNESKRFDVVTKENKLFSYISAEKPDIICLQEIKADLEQITEELRSPKGYNSYFHTCSVKKGYSGVAIFSKTEPLELNNKFGKEKFDGEGRFLEVKFKDFTLFNIYFPKGYTDNDRLDYKLEFYDEFFRYIQKLLKKEKNIIISGDYNTAHHEIDLARPKENVNTSGFLEVERKKLDELVKLGFIDSFRMFDNKNGTYSWWSQRGRARENNVGWRIDYNFVSQSLKDKVKNAYIQPHILGSDHCPVVLELK
ncbi:MAG: exodeoxyribonuclease III [Bacteroidota bacterium]